MEERLNKGEHGPVERFREGSASAEREKREQIPLL
jgi:hypothetical protein